MSKQSAFAHKFIAQPYGWTVYFFTDSEKWARYTARKTKTPLKENRASVDGVAGMTATVDEMQMAFLGVFDGEPGVLAHEATHCANAMLARAQIKIDFDNDEVQAYLIGHIFDQCFPALWKSK